MRGGLLFRVFHGLQLLPSSIITDVHVKYVERTRGLHAVNGNAPTGFKK